LPSTPAGEERLDRLGAALAGGDALAPDDDDVAGVAQDVGGSSDRLGGRPRAGAVGGGGAGAEALARSRLGGQVVDRPARARAAERGRQRADGRLGRAGREAQGGAGVRVEGRRARGGDHQRGPVAAHGLADAQVEDRRLLHELGVEYEDRAGVVDVADLRGQGGIGERAGLAA
jgi:hypothetical protein